MDIGTKFILCGILIILVAIGERGVPLKELGTVDLVIYIILFNFLLVISGVYS